MRGRKKERGEGEGRKKILFSLPAPYPAPFDSPYSLREVSTWRFREQIARSKKTPALQAISDIENGSRSTFLPREVIPSYSRSEGEIS